MVVVIVMMVLTAGAVDVVIMGVRGVRMMRAGRPVNMTMIGMIVRMVMSSMIMRTVMMRDRYSRLYSRRAIFGNGIQERAAFDP